MSFPLRRPAAALLIAAATALAGCNLVGGGEKPQPPPPTGPGVVLPPVSSAPLPPVGAIPAPNTPAAASGKIEVAMLVPLTGPSADVGEAMLDAAQMAIFDLGDNRLQLIVRDSGGAPDTAAAAAQSAIGDGAKMILGPLLAGEVEAVKPVAKTADVPVVAFSTATQLAGDGTWLMSFDPRQEIARVVIYAHAQGHNQFAALAPQTPYGDLAVNALRDAVALAGGNASVGPIVRYDPSAPNLGSTVQSLASQQGFDAVLIPEGGAKLKALAPLLPYYGIDPDHVKLIGTGLWADPTIGTEPALEGGWYAAPAPELSADFEQRFQALYNRKPPLLATLGYDAAALAAVLAKSPAGPNFSADALTNPSGFSGMNGVFRLLRGGLVERGLAVIEVHHDGPTVLDPAPQSFQKTGY